ncbi:MULTISPECIES: diaminobutyrate acetyltransferase [Thermomonospora]|uniref:L-2,4-diaminobutyric acid acetyltransferase n=1 Tax=Thermomonospora cellulosilytica TaxID=1411118 RepID=A0A7W3MV76_9ACTN|nr:MULTISPECIES: diaminobutyrate acetyltransferase [Thermomonospora]MBA9002463.1 L-2,4-diaminobutyric acid acetyltransferase [Thermomonospora cellulosilytica]
MAAQPLIHDIDPRRTESAIRLARPRPADGRELWRIARDSRSLDLNSPYAYALWCRDFADTSVVAHGPGGPCGFVTGYLRPGAPDTLFVWQVAVDDRHRGRGLAHRMLDELAARRPGVRHLEATVTPGNTASARLFESFARRRGCALVRRELFGPAMFPDEHAAHEPEVLYRIGPFAR